MTLLQILEVAVALALLVVAVVVYRRGGTQGGVMLMVVAALLAIHGLGLMEYRPSAVEMGL